MLSCKPVPTGESGHQACKFLCKTSSEEMKPEAERKRLHQKPLKDLNGKPILITKTEKNVDLINGLKSQVANFTNETGKECRLIESWALLCCLLYLRLSCVEIELTPPESSPKINSSVDAWARNCARRETNRRPPTPQLSPARRSL